MAPVKRKIEDGKPAARSKDENSSKRIKSDSKQEKAPRDSGELQSTTKSTLVAPTKEEKSFPRGGASVLTPLEYKEVTNEAARDVLFETAGEAAVENDEKSNKKRKTMHKSAQRREKSKKDETKEGDKGIKIQGLSYKRIVASTIVLGSIAQITTTDIAISLPNSLTGYVPITSISDQLTAALMQENVDIDSDEEQEGKDDSAEQKPELPRLKDMFFIGQWVRAYVLGANTEATTSGHSKKSDSSNKKHIDLSLVPRLTNPGINKQEVINGTLLQASVLSIEDQGFLMDLGLDFATGFLGAKEAGVPRSSIHVGQVFLCLVTGTASSGKVVKLSADFQKGVAKSKHNAQYISEAPTVDAFLPGTLVEWLLTEVKDTGLVGKIMGTIDVTVDLAHAGVNDAMDLEKKFKIGKKLQGRILHTFPSEETRKVAATLLSHNIALTTLKTKSGQLPLEALPIATIVESAKVIQTQQKTGLFLDVGIPGIRAFVHISKIADEKIESLPEFTGPYKIGSEHRARILGFNSTDGIFFASMEKKVLDQPFLRIEEIKAGQIVTGTIGKILANGIIVELAEGINVYVPDMHLSDVKLVHPEKKFREGATVKGRVLSTDPERHRVTMTLKKTLVNSESPLFTSYEMVQVGMQSPGTLTKILQNGAVVFFYNNVSAFLPVSEMSEAYIQDAREHFRAGQVVTVFATSVDVENHKLKVSCKDPAGHKKDQDEALSKFKIGSIVSGRVSEKSNDDVIIDIDGSAKGILVLGHLTDGSASKNSSTFKKLRAGQILPDLLVLDKNKLKHFIILTAKPALVKEAKAGKLIKAVDDVTVGQHVSGFVRNITQTALFVGFGGKMTGYLPRKSLPEQVHTLPDFGYHLSQTISCYVSEVYHDEGKFSVSLIGPESPKATTTAAVTTDARPTINPVDGVTNFIDSFQNGQITKARIISLKETQLNVELADNVKARVDVSELFDSWDDIKNKKLPIIKGPFKKEQIISVKVIGLHDTKNHKYLPISHRQAGKDQTVELTAKLSELISEKVALLSLADLSVGQSVVAYVNNISSDCLWVNISPTVRGRIRILDVSDDVSLLKDPEANFPLGSALKCTVTHVDTNTGKLDLSCRSGNGKALSLQDISTGMLVPARVTKIQDGKIIVQISDTVIGTMSLADMADDFSLSSANLKKFEKDDIIRVCIIGIDKPNKRVICSTRPSRVLSSTLPVQDFEITTVNALNSGEICRGFITHVADNGVYVHLGGDVTARVKISDVSDKFVKNWREGLSVDQLVKGKITAVDKRKQQVSMSFKQSVIDGSAKRTMDKYEKGQIVDAHVRKVMDFGVFVVIDGSDNVSGLCHKTELSDDRGKDALNLYAEGDLVKAKILKVDRAKGRISFGLKASYFKDLDLDAMDEPDTEDRIIINGLEEESEDDEEDGGVPLDVDESGSEGEDEDENDNDNERPKDIMALLQSSRGLNPGFDWNGTSTSAAPTTTEPESDEESDEESKKRKRRKKNKIKEDKTGDLQTRNPESSADFERLLLASPDSSFLWLSYMAYELQLGEINIARGLGERAIKTITMRNETAKMDVWVALLNLENTYGDDDTMEDVFKRACQYNDAQVIHERLSSIYIQSDKADKADALFQSTVKKFSQSPKVWLNYATFLMETRKNPNSARLLLPRALQAIKSPKEHVDLTLKFAQLEFKSGDPEKGRTFFEQLLDAYPKRFDLWNVFIDLEMKAGDKEIVRRVFARVVQLKKKGGKGMMMSAKQAKFLFNKWLAYEEKMGTAKDVAGVKAKAVEFAEELKAAKEAVEEEDDE